MPDLTMLMSVRMSSFLSKQSSAVSTNVGDIKNVVHDGENGFLIEPGDVIKLSNILLDFSLIDEKKWNEMSTCSRKIIECNYSINQYIQRMIEVYYEKNK